MSSNHFLIVKVLVDPVTFQTMLVMRNRDGPGRVSITLECLESVSGYFQPPTDKERAMMYLRGTYHADAALLENAMETGWESDQQLKRLRERMQQLYDQGAFHF